LSGWIKDERELQRVKQGGLAGMFEEALKHKSMGDVIGQLVCLISMLQAPPMGRGHRSGIGSWTVG
jgi:hypothetical protein